MDPNVIGKIDCFTHTLFLGRLAVSEVIKSARAMTYDYYHHVKHGRTPPKAPTFIRGEALNKERQI